MSTERSARACFFSTDAQLLDYQQYLLQDVRILKDLGFGVVVVNRLTAIPLKDIDLYYCWWATGGVLPILASKLARRPSVLVAGGNEVMLYRDSLSGVARGYLAAPWPKKMAARVSLMFADAAVVVSKHMKADAKAISGRDTQVVYNSVDSRLFYPRVVAAKAGSLSTVRKFVLCICNFQSSSYAVKRVANIIAAAEIFCGRFPDIDFMFIGRQGDMFADVCKDVERRGLRHRVAFRDMIPNVDLPEVFSAAHVYLQASDTETFGLSVVEAMSCGTPVVVSRVGAIPEVVGDCGVYVNQNDTQSISDGLARVVLMSDWERKDTVDRGLRRCSQMFSYSKRLQLIGGIVQDLGVLPAAGARALAGFA